MISTDEPNRGWGGMIGLGVAVAVFMLVIRPLYLRYSKIDNPSPPLPRGPRKGGVTGVSDPDGRGVTGWLGRVRAGIAAAGHIARTGDSPRHAEPDDYRDPDLDLDLDTPDRGETLEEWVARQVQVDGASDGLIAREGVRLYNVSETTVRRRIRDHRAGR